MKARDKGRMRRGLAIMLLAVMVLASRQVAKVSSAPNDEWRRSFVESFFGQRRHSALRNLFIQNSGEEVLPSAVREMLTLLRRHDIQEFTLSPEISADDLLYQRIIESAYPRKAVPTASHLLALIGEHLPFNCVETAALEEIQAAVCN